MGLDGNYVDYDGENTFQVWNWYFISFKVIDQGYKIFHAKSKWKGENNFNTFCSRIIGIVSIYVYYHSGYIS